MHKRDDSTEPQDLIEENLKKVYQETLEQDIPDRFKVLLARLKEAEESELAPR